MATSEAFLQVLGGSLPSLFGSDDSFRKLGSSHTSRSFIRIRKKRGPICVNFLNCSHISYRAIRVDCFQSTRQCVHGDIGHSNLRSVNCKCQQADSASSFASEKGNGSWTIDNDQSFDTVHGNTPSVMQFETVRELKVGEENFQSNGSLPPNGLVEDTLNRIAGNSIEDEAWELLRESMVYYCGSPVGTIAAKDPTSSTADVLNYDQVFIRDFIPSGIAFLLKGEYEIVRNFILHTLQLQSWEKTMDCHSPGQGLMPASFKVRTVPLDGDDSATEEVLDPDFGEAAIGRVAPVDSGLWWIILLRAYGKSSGDLSVQERIDVQTGIKMILRLCLADGFDMFPTLLVTDGSCMIDRRMGIHGHPLEIQALFHSALLCAREMLTPEDGSADLIRALNNRLVALSFHIREYYWIDMKKLNEIYRYQTEEYSYDAVNKFNIYPDQISPWLVDWMPSKGGYLIGNLQPAHMDFRFFSLGNLWSIVCSLTTDDQSHAILDLIEAKWTDLVADMPFKICYPALEGQEWKIITGCDPKNTPWSYHNGGSWPTLLWQLAVASIKMNRPEIAAKAVEVAEKRISQDKWPGFLGTANISLHQLPMATITLLFFLFLQLITATIATTSPPYNATVFVLLNCGAQSAITDDTGRRWDTDTHFPNFLPSDFSSISTTATALEQDPSVNRIPYTTGIRIMRSQFTYTFRVTPGTIFLRLYFYPANYSGFNKADSFFSVTANNLTLLSNFSAFFTVSASSTKAVQKEYVINVDETQMLKLTFSPSPNSYAFVNGIEILSMPTDLYIHGDVKLTGNTIPYNINNSTALETLYRLNVGGNLVESTEDTGMYRVWDSDNAFVVGLGYQTPHFPDANITYTSETPNYTAPTIVYTTSRIMDNYSSGLYWEFPLNSGFLYLFRLHFCEIQPEVKEINDRSFSISIGNQTAQREADVIQWSEGWRIPVYKDYVVRNLDGAQNLTLNLSPNPDSAYQNAILNGLEIFKLNDSNGNLSVPNPEVFFPNNSPPNNNKKKKSSHIIAVITAVAVISGIALFSILCFLIFRRWRRGKDLHTSVTKSSWIPLSITSDSTQRTGGSRSSSLPSDLCRHFLLEEIKTATGNFDEKFVIGYGGFGNVYKGYIDNGATIVAVKRLNPSSKQGVREFETEIHMLSKLRHVHLVSLIGYCDDKNEMILVYDYMANGTLRDHLYKTDNAPLPWKKRLEICIGAAKGLHYLHTGKKDIIIHRDVKSTNILLDDKWVAKVSDFGLSKIGPLSGSGKTHVSTVVKGSFGYLDPEYYKRQQLTEKSDVYSFGVVLFEVLCARPALIPNMPKGQVNLADWACRSCKKGNLQQIIDPNLEGQIAPECLNKFAEAAYNCLKDQGVQRPSMNDVVWNLEFILKLQEAADNRGHKMELNSYPTSPSFPLIMNDHTNISTDEGFEEFSGSNEVGEKYTSSASSMTTTSDDKLKSETIFSEILNPSGR